LVPREQEKCRSPLAELPIPALGYVLWDDAQFPRGSVRDTLPMCHSPLQHGLRQATHNTLGLGVSLFVWTITIDLSSKGDPTSSISYCQHSSLDHLITQALPLLQSGDTIRRVTHSCLPSILELQSFFLSAIPCCFVPLQCMLHTLLPSYSTVVYYLLDYKVLNCKIRNSLCGLIMSRYTAVNCVTMNYVI
jgi:hypothetical protein